MLYQIKADSHGRERGWGWKKGLKRSGCSQFFIVPRQTKHTYTQSSLTWGVELLEQCSELIAGQRERERQGVCVQPQA